MVRQSQILATTWRFLTDAVMQAVGAGRSSPFVILRQAALAAQTGGPSGARERDTVEGVEVAAKIAFGAAGSPGLRFASPEDDGSKIAA